jgi:hypothetical protein
MAADAHSLPRWQRQIDAAINGTTARPAGFNLDEYNQQGIDARKGKPIDDVVQEIRDGLHGDSAAVPGLDDALLAREVPNFRGELQPASDRLSFTTSRRFTHRGQRVVGFWVRRFDAVCVVTDHRDVRAIARSGHQHDEGDPSCSHIPPSRTCRS